MRKKISFIKKVLYVIDYIRQGPYFLRALDIILSCNNIEDIKVCANWLTRIEDGLRQSDYEYLWWELKQREHEINCSNKKLAR